MQIACLEQLIAAARDASLARDAADLLRDAYGALFTALDDTDVRRALYAASHRDRALYALLDTYATFVPALLLPVERPASHTRRGGQATALSDVRLVRWARTLPALVVPEMVPGLCTHIGDSSLSCVPQFLHLAALVGAGSRTTQLAALNHEIGARIAASLGRLLAVNYVYRLRQDPDARDTRAPGEVPPFDPVASVMLDQVYVRCGQLGGVPPSLFAFLAHVVHSVGADAVARLKNGTDTGLAAWEAAWRPTLEALARLVGLVHAVQWNDIFVPLLRPLCHFATMDGVSDDVSARIVRGLVQLLLRWARAPHEQAARDANDALFPWLLELEEALLMDGDPSLSIYHAALELHAASLTARGAEAVAALYPFPFYILASPPALHGSIATLAPLCGMVEALRTQAQAHAVPAAPVNEMLLALVDLVWSGRAYGSLLQHGLAIDTHRAIDPQTVAALKHACDARRIVPFGLIGSLSHSALLAALFEVYCNEHLLTGEHAFVRAPITPSALRPVRAHSLPAHMQYTDIRIRFLHWLAARGAPQVWQLLHATVPSLHSVS
ncbi:hypothetical protein MBRA1_003583 [Malassezia brasiliensis]|uniref:Uncharacterized protein n=1 Tax=Malassezia brasiliensis TaxID=1821822 RepID=A0AAF0IQ04_9BASI|nr:hypothetical protein MBRA1_003583 [Malassezia brasiliensis]